MLSVERRCLMEWNLRLMPHTLTVPTLSPAIGGPRLDVGEGKGGDVSLSVYGE